MNDNYENLEKRISKAFTASLIRFAVIAFVVMVCTWAFLPFLPLLMWSIVLAVALFPARKFLQAKLGLSVTKSSTVIALAGVLLIGVPTAMVANSLTVKTVSTFKAYEAGTLSLPAPGPSVKEWPLVGEDLHAAWSSASTDLAGFVEDKQPQLKNASSWIVGVISGAAGSVFMLIGAFIVAGIMLAWAEQAGMSIRRIFITFSDEARGPGLHKLTTGTLRQVAVGIIGIAFLTAMTFGLTVALAGVPAASVFTLIALLFAIMQLPVTLIAFVTVALLWSGDSSAVVHNSIFTVLMIAASLVDNVLKPMILGRGLDVPMPVVLIGAIGGMMSGGILGMFVGAAFLSAGYQVFMSWVESETQAAKMESPESAPIETSKE
ncbi:AI-2E family transporter [Motilimonas eburnea]|uniref:AI-2E family transporter n=1 Tax=Motilimonas eburnea TaxID=1737488 RepID=UPI001E5E7CEB|nr:AI-2E family transporter [Motilimonas eburnea]MCE2570276.1 AI-2E family transporter [Motilimonas eburnea]